MMREPGVKTSTCLFCGSTSHRTSIYPPTAFNGRKFEYRTCADCRLVYLHPPLTETDLQQLYGTSYHDEHYYREPGKTGFKRSERLIKNYCAGRRLLDFGCGDSSFLHHFSAAGYDVTGVELSPDHVQRLRGRFPQIVFLSGDEFRSGRAKTYDVIHAGDVLEHMTAPGPLLAELRSRLASGGILFLEGPLEHNANPAFYARASWFRLRRILFAGRAAGHRPYHTFFSDRNNQRALFESLGLQTLRYHVYEHPWPFTARLSDVHNFHSLIQYVIAVTSCFLSSFVPGWGNRFVYVGKAYPPGMKRI